MKNSIKYRSKIGLLWITACILVFGATVWIFATMEFDLTTWEFWMTAIIMIPCVLLMINLTVDNYAKFENDYLQVKCGVFTNIKIPYLDIVRFKETRNPISSVGLSTDRLSILFKAQNGGNGNDEVLISPVRKQEFIKILEEKTRKSLTMKNH